MTLRKNIIDKSVRYIPITGKTKETVPRPRKQHKNISQNNKKSLENISTQGFTYPK